MALPKIPRLQLPLLDTLHADFIGMFNLFAEQQLTPDLCHRLATNVEAAMDDRQIAHDAIFQTLMQYEGRTLDQHWCSLLARQLVARHLELRAGVLQLFERPTRDEWVPMEITATEQCLWRDEPTGRLVSFYCLAGHPAGHTLKKKFPENWLAWLAYQIGYSKRTPYEHDPDELIGMQFWGYLLAARQAPDDLDFDEWKVDRQTKANNQAILKLRRRFDIEPHQIPDGKEQDYSCPIDRDDYCSDCTQSVAGCIAAINRERTNVRGLVLDGQAAHHPQPG